MATSKQTKTYLKSLGIKRISINNFKGIKAFEIILTETTTIIRGANTTGKTTILDAYMWLLFNKDSLGNEKFHIRSLDKDGNKIHNTVISVEMEIEDTVTKDTITFKKSQKENWVKKRGSENPVLQGNVNSYEVDGYPCNESAYKAKVAELVDEQMFKLLSDPRYFTSLKWKDARSLVFQMVETIADADLAEKMDAELYAPIMKDLQAAPSTDVILQKYRSMLSEFKKKQTELPIRIDELHGQIKEIPDVTERNAKKEELQKELEAVHNAQTEAEKKRAEADNIREKIMDLKYEMSACMQKASADNRKKNTDLMMKKVEIESAISGLEMELNIDKRNYERYKSELERYNNSLKSLNMELSKAHAETFDTSAETCPTCGQKLPAKRIKAIRAEFEERKQNHINHVENEIAETQSYIDKLTADIKNMADTGNAKAKELKQQKKKLADNQKKLDAIPKTVDLSKDKAYQKVLSEIEANEAKLSSIEIPDSHELRRQETSILDELMQIETQTAYAEQNDSIIARIEDLQEEQRAVAQKVMDAEHMVYLVEQFIRAKCEYISDEINSKFDGVTFKLFDIQINGGLKETCEVMVDGVPFGSLNNGHRIVAGLQIIKAFQKMYKLYVPVWIDNAESINDYNIPKMECQTILLKVTDDKVLKVGE